jgi:hypothetical protein
MKLIVADAADVSDGIHAGPSVDCVAGNPDAERTLG